MAAVTECRLELYRRHTPKCPHRSKGQNYTKCRCPIWVDGEVSGRRYRRSLGLRDWARAVKRVGQIEEKPEQATLPRSLVSSIDLYVSDCRVRNLKESTITSYRKTLDHLRGFLEAIGRRSIEDLDLSMLTDYRASRTVQRPGEDKPRPIAGTTSGKELETLRAFCAFAELHGWIPENYARKLKPPKEDGPPTLPFTRDEVDRILEACGRLEDDNTHTVERTRCRARALCLVLLYSGLRFSDAVKLERKAVDLQTGKLLLRVMKTGVPLYVRLGDLAIEALHALPVESEKYFFWNGLSKLSTCIGNARKTIRRVSTLAGVHGHPHRFRDTFSVRLLELGNDLHTVQLLLGHTSIKTTEKHYAPWVKSRQAQLDAATAGLDFGAVVDQPKRRGKLLKLRH